MKMIGHCFYHDEIMLRFTTFLNSYRKKTKIAGKLNPTFILGLIYFLTFIKISGLYCGNIHLTASQDSFILILSSPVV